MEFVELLSNISWVSIVLFIIGIGLIVVEMFEPGIGFFGVFGIISLIACIFVTAQTVLQGLLLTGFFFVLLLILLGVFLVIFSKGRVPRKLILHESETVDQGFTGTEDMKYLMGRSGIVTTTCRPVGNVNFDGVKLDVVSLGEFIEKGTTVEVIEIEGNRIVVREKKEMEDK